MRRLYGHRREVMVSALEKYFGSSAIVLGDAAGMHSLVRFEDGGVAERAVANKVHMVSSAGYYLGSPPKNEFIFGFSCVSEQAIRAGIRRIAR